MKPAIPVPWFEKIELLEERSSGLGTITFGTAMGGVRMPPGWPTMGMYSPPPAFASVRDAARVYRVLQDARAAARQD